MHFIYIVFVIAKVTPHEVAGILDNYFNRHINRPANSHVKIYGLPRALFFRKIKWKQILPDKKQMKREIVNALMTKYPHVKLQDIDIQYEKPSLWERFGNKLVFILGIMGAGGSIIAFLAWIQPYAFMPHP